MFYKCCTCIHVIYMLHTFCIHVIYMFYIYCIHVIYMLNTCCILDFRFCVQRVLQACLVSLVLAWNEIYSARCTGRCETQDLQLCINI